MALGERFTRSEVACEFSFLPYSRTARGDGRRVFGGFVPRSQSKTSFFASCADGQCRERLFLQCFRCWAAPNGTLYFFTFSNVGRGGGFFHQRQPTLAPSNTLFAAWPFSSASMK